jgi:hypothetical protein
MGRRAVPRTLPVGGEGKRTIMGSMGKKDYEEGGGMRGIRKGRETDLLDHQPYSTIRRSLSLSFLLPWAQWGCVVVGLAALVPCRWP